ncbi:hypothetical protein M569_12329 [Genlisea aurea]|uniref:DUF7780 domain-containing protein n=1 Tax=Genlisea aurea TaxID=192259 RepID=S8DRP3_9LAMI|nr:hypothetical protein M569_12329 [Genlisea aurea]
MGFGRTAADSHAHGVDGWGMGGFLLIFFPPENDNRRRPNFNFFCQLRRYLLRAQLIVSISLLLFFSAALMCAINSLPSTAAVPRRKVDSPPRAHALQGMGVLNRRGTGAMNDVVFAHASESVTSNELRMFLRLFLRSNLAARSDLVLIFPARKPSSDEVILQETHYFSKILSLSRQSSGNDSRPPVSFDVTPFLKTRRKEKRRSDPIWGKTTKPNFSGDGETESTLPNYGSVVSFETDELDPENSLSGFMDHVPMSLRRWACYPILMGRVKRNYKHIILIDIKTVALVNDPMTRFRSNPPESIVIRSSSSSSSSGRKTRWVDPDVIMGGTRGVRRLSNAMLMSLVRTSMQQHRRKKATASESDVLNRLIENEFVLSGVNLMIVWDDDEATVPESSSPLLDGHSGSNLVRWGNVNLDSGSLAMKHICSFRVDSLVYRDCRRFQTLS